jgi:hypothetical protein
MGLDKIYGLYTERSQTEIRMIEVAVVFSRENVPIAPTPTPPSPCPRK